MTAAAMVAVSVVAACGSPESPAATLPPIATTSTTTTTIYVSTTVVYRYHEVQSGETLFKIAETYGVSVDDIIAVNGIDDPDHIEAGSTLKIPPGEQPMPAATTSTSTSTVAP